MEAEADTKKRRRPYPKFRGWWIVGTSFLALYLTGVAQLFSAACLVINTIGAIGDCWIVRQLLRHGRGCLVQDTKAGVEIWERPSGEETLIP